MSLCKSHLCFLSLYTVLKMSRSGPGAVSMLLQIWSTVMNVPVLPTPALQCTRSGPPVLWVLRRTWVSWTRVTRWPGSPPPGADLTWRLVTEAGPWEVLPVWPVSQLEVDDHPAVVLPAGAPQPALAAPRHVQLPHAVIRSLKWDVSSNPVSMSVDTSTKSSPRPGQTAGPGCLRTSWCPPHCLASTCCTSPDSPSPSRWSRRSW